MINEGRVMLRVKKIKNGRRRIEEEIMENIVDLIEKEKRIGIIRIINRMDEIEGNREDIGEEMKEDLRIVE